MRALWSILIGALVITGCGATSPTTTAGSTAPTTDTTAVAATAPSAAPSTDVPSTGRDVTVESVVDGDTIVVSGGERVRLIGIDTPETKDPRSGVQCFGREAAAWTTRLLPQGTDVRLVRDVEPSDRYGRTLAYVYRLEDGLFVNAALVTDGYAVTATYPPNVAHAEEFAVLAQQARQAGRGLWSACQATQEPAPAAPNADGCDAAYPDACIPPAPPDLDCGDIAERRFAVMAPDPHGFDRDGDGVGCES